ncbi:hypothetical protein I7I48_01251 [Histoplasma ohiense]|nr:hypothetical protein I7I48_01251 [Histoplasma ohiense (nom. inval.)]
MQQVVVTCRNIALSHSLQLITTTVTCRCRPLLTGYNIPLTRDAMIPMPVQHNVTIRKPSQRMVFGSRFWFMP